MKKVNGRCCMPVEVGVHIYTNEDGLEIGVLRWSVAQGGLRDQAQMESVVPFSLASKHHRESLVVPHCHWQSKVRHGMACSYCLMAQRWPIRLPSTDRRWALTSASQSRPSRQASEATKGSTRPPNFHHPFPALRSRACGSVGRAFA